MPHTQTKRKKKSLSIGNERNASFSSETVILMIIFFGKKSYFVVNLNIQLSWAQPNQLKLTETFFSSHRQNYMVKRCLFSRIFKHFHFKIKLSSIHHQFYQVLHTKIYTYGSHLTPHPTTHLSTWHFVNWKFSVLILTIFKMHI